MGVPTRLPRGPAGIIFVRERDNRIEFLLGREKRWRPTPAIDSQFRCCYSKFVYTHAFGKFEPDIDVSVEDTAIREAKEEHPGLVTPEIEKIIRSGTGPVRKCRLIWKVDNRSHKQHGWFIVVMVGGSVVLGTQNTKDCPLPSMRWCPEHLLPNPINYPAYAVIRHILSENINC